MPAAFQTYSEFMVMNGSKSSHHRAASAPCVWVSGKWGGWIYPALGCEGREGGGGIGVDEVERKGVGVRIGSKQVRRAVRLQNTDGREELGGSVNKNSPEIQKLLEWGD